MTNLYDVLVRPLVTEKSSYQSGKLSQYSFVVAKEATRTSVKDAVETLFDVTVARVNILNAPANSGTEGLPVPSDCDSDDLQELCTFPLRGES